MVTPYPSVCARSIIGQVFLINLDALAGCDFDRASPAAGSYRGHNTLAALLSTDVVDPTLNGLQVPYDHILRELFLGL